MGSRFEEVHLDKHPAAKALCLTLLLNLSLCRLRMGEHLRAQNAATRALKLDPGSEKGLYRRAEAAMHLGNYAEAESDLSSLLKKNTHNASATQLLRRNREKRRLAASLSQQQASKMLSSGGLYTEGHTTSVSAGTKGDFSKEDTVTASAETQENEMPAAKWENIRAELNRAASGGWGTQRQTQTVRDRDPVELPPAWKTVIGPNGEEVWQRLDDGIETQ